MQQQLPIIIVGAGPVGLSLARALTLAGIPAHVYESLPELSPESRASTFHPPTLEMFSAWGVIDPVLSQGHIVRRLQYWERATRSRVADFDYSLIARDTPHPYRLQLPQSEVTRIFKPMIESHPQGAVFMNHTLASFEDRGDHVTAIFETPDGLKTVEGLYLCAADGSKSTVRRQLGLGFEGLTYPDRFLLLPSEIDLAPVFPNLGPVNYVFDPLEWVIILHLPGVVRIVFQIRPDEDESEVLDPANIQRRMLGLVGDAPFNIRGTSIYSVHQRVAETFRRGRVLLLGDAAHINNPAGGMGMNSGIHDAANLADKFIRVLAGESDSLLDQYASERRAWAVDKVQKHTHVVYLDMVVQDEAARQARNAHYREMAADPAKARAYLLRASMLEERI